MERDDAQPRIQAVEIRPIGAAVTRVADDVVRLLSRRISLPCRLGTELSFPALPSLEHRAQADADALLALVEADHTDPESTLIALTHVDLGHPLFTFFFGRARIGGAALVSTARLDPRFHAAPADPRTLVRRTVAESLHELGHVAGLQHCRDYACVMRFTGDVEMLDLRGETLCDACAARAPAGLRRRRTMLGWFAARGGDTRS